MAVGTAGTPVELQLLPVSNGETKVIEQMVESDLPGDDEDVHRRLYALMNASSPLALRTVSSTQAESLYLYYKCRRRQGDSLLLAWEKTLFLMIGRDPNGALTEKGVE